MQSLTSFEFNPWSELEANKLGNTSRLLSLARNLGYQFGSPEQSSAQRLLSEQSVSFQTLELMKDISKAEDKLHSTNREIERILLDKDSFDLTNLTRLEERIDRLNALSSHLGETVDKKSIITHRLQEPYRGDTMKIDASQHKDVVGLFTALCPLLSDLSYLLETIEWTSNNAPDFSRKTDVILHRLNSSLAEIQNRMDTITKMRSTVDELAKSSKLRGAETSQLTDGASY